MRLAGGIYSASDTNDVLQVVSGGDWRTYWRYATSNNKIEIYDRYGKLTGIIDRTGLIGTLTYDTVTKLLSSVTDSYGRGLTFAHDGNMRITSMTDPAGGRYIYAYDGNNNLTSVTYPDGKTKQYLYENASLPHALTGIIDENGVRYATYGYDGASGQATSESLAGGAAATMLNFGSNSTTVTDALATQRTYNFQTILGVQKLTSQSQPGGSGCGASASALTYDVNGNLKTRTDFNGNTTTYSYDLSRNLETQRVEASGKPEQRTISTQWHSYWRLPTLVAEPLKRTTYLYNGDTYNSSTVTCAPADATVPSITGGTQPIGVLCQKIEQATTDANGSLGVSAPLTGTPRTWAWTYTKYGQVLTAKGPRTDVSDLTRYTYYAADDPDMGKRGNLASITNALGQVTRITAYDLNGRPLTIVDPNNVTTELRYDLRGRLTRKTVDNETTTYTYDPVGQLKLVSLPDGSSLGYTYDDAHRLTDITDAAGNRIHYTLDGLGNRTREDVFDPAAQLAQTRSRVFDALSRLYQDVTAQNKITTYAYDANGNLTGITDPLSHTTVQGFDALNRLIRITDPAQAQTRFAYDGQDRLTQVTDPRSLVTRYTIDGLGNQTALQSPDTGSTVQSVDAAGNVTSRTDAKGQKTTYQYDALNRLIQVTLADGAQQRYTWDQGNFGLGRLSAIAERDAKGTEIRRTDYGYDAQGRVVREVRTLAGFAYRTSYAYSGGRLAGMTYPSGRTLTYTYDSAGRITQIDTRSAAGVAQTLVSQVAYHPFGGIKSFTYGNGQTYTRSLDQDGRIASYSLAGQTQSIGYDDASRIATLTDAATARTTQYDYDAVDRLTRALLPNAGYGYAYDATGNRTAQTIGGATTPVTIDPASNWIQSVGPRSYQYDANGSVIRDGIGQYGYDVRGRLVQATGAAGTTAYQLNAQGERVMKSASGTDRLYHYDRQGHLIAEGGAQGQIDREYIYLGDLPVAVVVQ